MHRRKPMKLSFAAGIQSFRNILTHIGESERKEFLLALDDKFNLEQIIMLKKFEEKYPEVYLFLTSIDEDKFVGSWIEALIEYNMEEFVTPLFMINDEEIEVEIDDSGFTVAPVQELIVVKGTIPVFIVDRSKALQLAQILNSETTSLKEKVILLEELTA